MLLVSLKWEARSTFLQKYRDPQIHPQRFHNQWGPSWPTCKSGKLPYKPPPPRLLHVRVRLNVYDTMHLFCLLSVSTHQHVSCMRAKIFIKPFPRMARGTEEGLKNIGGVDDFTLAWKLCNKRLWTTWSLALLQITWSQSPRACWEGKSWKPSPLLHSKIFCLSGLAWIREDSSTSECRQDAYLFLHLFVTNTILCCVGIWV